MKGEVISCSHKDIYFLETNTKSESMDLANLFASPAGREMLKYKPRTKLKQKLNPALEFFINNNASKSQTISESTKSSQDPPQCPSTSQIISSESGSVTTKKSIGSRRNSIDLYEEAAAILGLTCSQTDNCKCIECQCHYFDFEEDLDFPSDSDCMMGHNSSCSIQ